MWACPTHEFLALADVYPYAYGDEPINSWMWTRADHCANGARMVDYVLTGTGLISAKKLRSSPELCQRILRDGNAT